MANKKPFSVTGALNLGWRLVMRDFGTILKLWLAALVLMMGPQLLTSAMREDLPGLIFIVSLGVWVLQMVVSVGLVNVGLMIARNKGVRVMDLLEVQAKTVIGYMVAMVLVGLGVFFGLLLLVIPGIWLALYFSMTQYVLIDKDMGPVEAMQKSGELTQGVKWQLLGFSLSAVFINLIGALMLGVGLIITIPWTWMAGLVIYLKLSGEDIKGLPKAETT